MGARLTSVVRVPAWYANGSKKAATQNTYKIGVLRGGPKLNLLLTESNNIMETTTRIVVTSVQEGSKSLSSGLSNSKSKNRPVHPQALCRLKLAHLKGKPKTNKKLK